MSHQLEYEPTSSTSSSQIVDRSMIRRFVDLFTRVRPLTCSRHYKLSPRELRDMQDLREMIQELREEENETASW